MRNFEYVKKEFTKQEQKVDLPIRSSKHSAGYDFFSPIDITIKPNEIALIWTDVRAKMENDEVLFLLVRSSMGKHPVVLSNGTGVIDSDYYDNETTGGNIGFRLHNLGTTDYEIKTGDKIGQGIFIKYLTTDDDNANTERKGGFGSSGK